VADGRPYDDASVFIDLRDELTCTNWGEARWTWCAVVSLQNGLSGKVSDYLLSMSDQQDKEEKQV
jgi:hypothetical protein